LNYVYNFIGVVSVPYTYDFVDYVI
jgi:hypothetical protein